VFDWRERERWFLGTQSHFYICALSFLLEYHPPFFVCICLFYVTLLLFLNFLGSPNWLPLLALRASTPAFSANVALELVRVFAVRVAGGVHDDGALLRHPHRGRRPPRRQRVRQRTQGMPMPVQPQHTCCTMTLKILVVYLLGLYGKLLIVRTPIFFFSATTRSSLIFDP